MNSIPSVNYRFGDTWLITDFVNPNISVNFSSAGDKLVEEVAAFIRDQFRYPLVGGNPSADGQFRRFHKNLCRYHFSQYAYYMWSFPQETLLIGKGICIDTANLATSLLVSKLNALVCLGEVRTSREDTLLGYHAWTLCPYKNDIYLLETTIHEMGINNLVTVSSAYGRNSDWAKQGNIYYLEKARYNNTLFSGDTSIVAGMALPANRILLYGLDEAKIYPKRKLYKEWRQEEIIKTKLLRQAFSLRR